MSQNKKDSKLGALRPSFPCSIMRSCKSPPGVPQVHPLEDSSVELLQRGQGQALHSLQGQHGHPFLHQLTIKVKAVGCMGHDTRPHAGRDGKPINLGRGMEIKGTTIKYVAWHTFHRRAVWKAHPGKTTKGAGQKPEIVQPTGHTCE